MDGYNEKEELAELLQIEEAELEAIRENEQEHIEAGLLCNPIEADITISDLKL